MTLPTYLASVRERCDNAHTHINHLSQGARWTMSIPVHSTDSDMTLQAPLDDLTLLLQIVERAVETLDSISISIMLTERGESDTLPTPDAELAIMALSDIEALVRKAANG